jgi:hypothetical protein
VIAGGRFLFDVLHDAKSALDLVKSALAVLTFRETLPDQHLLLLGIQCAEVLGESGELDQLLELGLAVPAHDDLSANTMTLTESAKRLHRTGSPDQAEQILRRTIALLKAPGDERLRAVTMGKVAGILQTRGELDEALRIRLTEELPTYKRVEDTRSFFICIAEIFDIASSSGRMQDPLRIWRSRAVPLWERLGSGGRNQIVNAFANLGSLGKLLELMKEKIDLLEEQFGIELAEVTTVTQAISKLDSVGELGWFARTIKEEGFLDKDLNSLMLEIAEAIEATAEVLDNYKELPETAQILIECIIPIFALFQNPHPTVAIIRMFSEALARKLKHPLISYDCEGIGAHT